MNLFLGVALLAATALIMSLAVTVFRRRDAGEWTRRESSAVAVSLLCSTMLTFGAGFLVAAMINLPAEVAALGVFGDAALAGLVVLAIWAIRRVIRAGRRRAAEHAAEVAPFPPVGPAANHRGA